MLTFISLVGKLRNRERHISSNRKQYLNSRMRSGLRPLVRVVMPLCLLSGFLALVSPRFSSRDFIFSTGGTTSILSFQDAPGSRSCCDTVSRSLRYEPVVSSILYLNFKTCEFVSIHGRETTRKAPVCNKEFPESKHRKEAGPWKRNHHWRVLPIGSPPTSYFLSARGTMLDTGR